MPSTEAKRRTKSTTEATISMIRRWPLHDSFPKNSKPTKVLIRNPWINWCPFISGCTQRLSAPIISKRGFSPGAQGGTPFCSLFDMKGNLLVDHIGRYENLDKDFGEICSLCNIERATLPRTNSSSMRHYSEYYDRETRAFVQTLCDREIVEFGYQF